MNKILSVVFKYLSFLVVFLALALAVIAGRFLLEKDPFHIEVDGEQPHLGELGYGEDFFFSRLVCSDKHLGTAMVDRIFINQETNVRHMLGQVGYPIEAWKDGCQQVTFSVRTPSITSCRSVPPGDYYYNPILNYNVNPLRRVTRPAPGVYFTLVDRDDAC